MLTKLASPRIATLFMFLIEKFCIDCRTSSIDGLISTTVLPSIRKNSAFLPVLIYTPMSGWLLVIFSISDISLTII